MPSILSTNHHNKPTFFRKHFNPIEIRKKINSRIIQLFDNSSSDITYHKEKLEIETLMNLRDSIKTEFYPEKIQNLILNSLQFVISKESLNILNSIVENISFQKYGLFNSLYFEPYLWENICSFLDTNQLNQLLITSKGFFYQCIPFSLRRENFNNFKFKLKDLSYTESIFPYVIHVRDSESLLFKLNVISLENRESISWEISFLLNDKEYSPENIKKNELEKLKLSNEKTKLNCFFMAVISGSRQKLNLIERELDYSILSKDQIKLNMISYAALGNSMSVFKDLWRPSENKFNFNCKLPLHIAAAGSSDNMVITLCDEFNFNPKEKDKNGFDAYDYAKRSSFPGLMMAALKWSEKMFNSRQELRLGKEILFSQ